MTTTKREALAEALCNLAGEDPNNDAAWESALLEADQQIAESEGAEAA